MQHKGCEELDGPLSRDDDVNPVPITVFDLGEFVFCPRAGMIARESADDAREEGEPLLGPKLGMFWDYSEIRFNDEIKLAWSWMRFWTILLVPAILLVYLLGHFVSPLAAALGAIPLGFALTHAGIVLRVLFSLVWHRREMRMATTNFSAIDLTEISPVNWWTLRKSGFDCWKPDQSYSDPSIRLTGKPWRVLIQGDRVRIPVIRKHHGASLCQPQHIVKLMAYCHLLDVCEGAQSPFGILMFNDSYDCILVPNVAGHRHQFEEALDGFRRLLSLTDRNAVIPERPTDRRCCGCHLGEPRLFVPQMSETLLAGIVRPPFMNGPYHSTCGDRFGWIPPYGDGNS